MRSVVPRLVVSCQHWKNVAKCRFYHAGDDLRCKRNSHNASESGSAGQLAGLHSTELMGMTYIQLPLSLRISDQFRAQIISLARLIRISGAMRYR
jgi:hypothetical protein